jgi:hypothetical protein
MLIYAHDVYFKHPCANRTARAFAAAIAIAISIAAAYLGAQTPPASPARPEFDVASVKPDKTGDNTCSTNIPLGPGSVFPDTGGFLSATNCPLVTYISFAYRIMGNQAQLLLAQLPRWVTTEYLRCPGALRSDQSRRAASSSPRLPSRWHRPGRQRRRVCCDAGSGVPDLQRTDRRFRPISRYERMPGDPRSRATPSRL